MKKVILTYGVIAGGLVSAMLLISQPLFKNGTLTNPTGEIIGFTSMIVSLSLIFFGIRTYRDTYAQGSITFYKAFVVGILIALVASVLYAGAWEISMATMTQDFAEKYSQAQLDELIRSGASEQEITEAKGKMKDFVEMYANPVIRFGFTLMEIFPIGLLITLVSAGILKKTTQSTSI